jgi:hypothetical protein
VSTRGYLIAGACVLVAIVGAFSAGRFSAPLKVETREVEKVVFKDRIVEKVVTVEVKAKAETKTVYVDRVITKEGTVTERIVERTVTKEDTKKTGNTDTDTTTDRTTERTTEKVVTLRPNWRVGALVGASLKDPLLPIAGPLVLGLEVDYRLIGGLSVGLWANTYGAAGVALAFEF